MSITDAELREAVEIAMREHFNRPVRVAEFRRRPSAYRTSFAIEELSVRLDDGAAYRMIFKNLSRDALHDDARAAKPEFLYEPLREIEVYRTILARAGGDSGIDPVGTAICYGAIVDPPAGQYWLFLEEVPGRELYQFGEFDVWRRVSRWLAEFHAKFASRQPSGLVLSYDENFYRTWLDRARRFTAGAHRPLLDRVSRAYDGVIERLLRLPRTLIHGEFYASNIIVADQRVCPVDWEMAAVAPGHVDLAALVSGKWTEDQKLDLATEYHAAAGGEVTKETTIESLDLCRLHLAVQWLGWAENWSPPQEHTQDWIGETAYLMDKLRL